MARKLPADFNRATIDQVTTPVYLFEVDGLFRAVSFDEPGLMNGARWTPCNFTVQGPEPRAGGTYEASISMPYDFANLMKRILAGRITDRPCALWKTYFYQDAYLDPVLLLRGIVLDVILPRSRPRAYPQVVLSITSAGNRGGVTPYIRVAPPLMKHITPAGTTIVWGEQTVAIDR